MLRYLYTGPFATFLIPESARGAKSTPFVAALRSPAPTKVAAQDLWGNVRVPRIEALPKFTKGATHWLPVPRLTKPEQFSSLFGVPVVGLPPAGGALAANFTLETSYLSLKCVAWEKWRRNAARPRNISGSYELDASRTFSIAADMPWSSWENASAVAEDPQPRFIYFHSDRPDSDNSFIISSTLCVVTESHVEAAVTCQQGRSCHVTRMRRSAVDTRPAVSVPLEHRERLRVVTNGLANVEISHGNSSSDVEIFLRAGTLQQSTVLQNRFVDMSQVPPENFANRLLLLLNTIYQLSLVTQAAAFYDNNPRNLSEYGFDFGQLPANGRVAQSVVDDSCRLFCSRGTQATLAHSVEVFAYSRFWLAVLFSSSAFLLAIGLAGSVLDRFTLVPDMLGYVASMTYNNPHLPIPARGGVLDAMDRARILFDLRVSVADVRGGFDVGHVAFTSGTNVRRLEKGRRYT
jgi:hypothetical protein